MILRDKYPYTLSHITETRCLEAEAAPPSNDKSICMRVWICLCIDAIVSKCNIVRVRMPVCRLLLSKPLAHSRLSRAQSGENPLSLLPLLLLLFRSYNKQQSSLPAHSFGSGRSTKIHSEAWTRGSTVLPSGPISLEATRWNHLVMPSVRWMKECMRCSIKIRSCIDKYRAKGHVRSRVCTHIVCACVHGCIYACARACTHGCLSTVRLSTRTFRERGLWRSSGKRSSS